MLVIGRLDEKIASILGIDVPDDPMIYLGEQNIQHMMSSHPDDYSRYGDKIGEIVSSPDYVYLDTRDGSIEFVKEFVFFGEFIKVAVRATASSVLYARTLYVLREERVQSYINSGLLKKCIDNGESTLV